MDVKTYAAQVGISEERVRQLARVGKIDAMRVDGRWEIEYAGSPRVPPTRRPLSARSRAETLQFFVTMKLDHVKGVHKVRLARRYQELMATSSKSRLLLEWWGGDEPEGTFAERNFIKAAQNGDEAWLDVMLEYPDAWVLVDAETAVARLTDRILLRGMTVEEVVNGVDLPEEISRELISTGKGYGLVERLKVYRAADLRFAEVSIG